MKENTLIPDKLKYISDEIFQTIKNYVINKDDLYLTIAGTIGEAGIVPTMFDNMNLTENAVKLTNIQINKSFLLKLIQSPAVQYQFHQKTNKVAQPKLAIERILSTYIPLPPLKEQERIVSRITTLDPLIEEYDKVETELRVLNETFPDQIKKSILQYAIQGKLVSQDPNEEPASVLLEKIKAEKQKLIKAGKIKKDKIESYIYKRDNRHYEKIGDKEVDITDEIPFEIPDSWAWVRLGNVINLISGRDLTPTEYCDKHVDSAIGYITGASNIENYQVKIRRWTKFPRVIVEQGDLLLTCKGTIGLLAFLPCAKAHIARQIMAISKQTDINMFFLQFFLMSYLEELHKRAKSMIPGISRHDVLSIFFPLPPLKEQQRIVEKIEQLFKILL